jgi:regulator of protease activity HflC (stomatin/prohibitin superfamily)
MGVILLVLAAIFAVGDIVVMVFEGSSGPVDAITITAVGTFMIVILFVRTAYYIRSYEIGVVTVLRKYRGHLKPGLHLVPPIAMVRRIDTRAQSVEIPGN